MSKMLIVGLGNPGKKYENTRHNAGHMIIDELEKQNLDGFILAKTNTFMNESGKAVKSLIRHNKTMVELRRMYDNLYIVHDDIDLPIGEFKIQKGRGAAGHKGVQSIIDELGTKDFWRLRIGICPEAGKPKNVEKFVLENFTKEEKKTIKEVVGKAIDAIGNIA